MNLKTGKKQARGRFQPGQSGNPAGRPVGARNKTTLALESLLEGQAEALTQLAVQRALQGDMQALKLCLDRILPPRRDRSVAFDLPPLAEAADAREAFAAIVAATAAGELTLAEAEAMTRLVERFAAVDAATHNDRRRRLRKEKGIMADLLEDF